MPECDEGEAVVWLCHGLFVERIRVCDWKCDVVETLE